MTVRFSVTVRQVREDGSEAPLDGELAAALAAPAEQFAGLAAWAADEARYLDHGEREKVIGDEGRELQRLVLQAAFDDAIHGRTERYREWLDVVAPEAPDSVFFETSTPFAQPARLSPRSPMPSRRGSTPATSATSPLKIHGWTRARSWPRLAVCCSGSRRTRRGRWRADT